MCQLKRALVHYCRALHYLAWEIRTRMGTHSASFRMRAHAATPKLSAVSWGARDSEKGAKCVLLRTTVQCREVAVPLAPPWGARSLCSARPLAGSRTVLRDARRYDRPKLQKV